MISTLAYEIGAVFLLAALLMYGTANGLVPRSLRVGKTLPIVLAAGTLAFAIYRFGPDLYEDWRSASAVAPGATAARLAPGRTPASGPTKPGAPPARATKQANTNWKTIIIESVPAAADPVATPIGKPAENAARTNATATGAQPASKASESSPYDSGATRAIKSVGHFLHLGRNKEQ
jgi:hypothetical protein